MRRWLKSVLVYASFTASAISWRCSSTSSTATSASFREASVAASVLPKSKRSCESWTCARKVSPNCRDWIESMLRPAKVVVTLVLSLREALTSPLSCGRRGASDWFTRKRAAA